MVYITNSTWRIAIRLQKVVGAWPYQGKVQNYSRLLSSFLVLSGSVFGLMTSLIKNWNVNFATVLENFTELIPPGLLMVKLVTLFFVEKKRRRILEQVAGHFETVVEGDEVQILCDFANKGLMLTIISTLSISAGVTIFLMSPYVRMYFLYFFGDGELSKILPMPVDYLVDEKKYFYCIAFDMVGSLVMALMIQLSFDLTLFMTVRHACALFEIVKLRLARASEIFEQCAQNKNDKNVSDSDEEKAYEILSSAVDLHNDAFELIQLIDETYNVCMFIVLLLNAAVIAPFPAAVMLYLHEPYELFRRGMGLIVYPVHLHVAFLQGQLVIDYSSSVFDACYEFQWYNTSKRCREVVKIIMSRSFTPGQLTGGNMFYLSMETYSVMLKTAISYISMFAAFLE